MGVTIPRGNNPPKKNQRRKSGIAKGTHINKKGQVVRNVGRRQNPTKPTGGPRY